MIIKIDKYTILIDDNAMSQIVVQQNGNHKKERGGVILGSVTNDFRIIVRNIPKATSDKKSLKYSCIRDRRVAQKIISDVFEKTDGIVTYLGEWHTHPIDAPTYSSQDKKTIKDQFLSNKITVDFLLMIIIGRKKMEVSLYNGYKLLSVSKDL